MWPTSALCDLLEIEHPIIQAPMVGSCSPALASAVSNAGGLGSLGCGRKPITTIRSEVEVLRSATNRAFNLNFFIQPAPETSDEVLNRTRERLQPWYDKFELGEPKQALPSLGPSFSSEHLELLLDLKPKVVSFHFGVPEAGAMATLKSEGILLMSSATSVVEAQSLEAAGVDVIIAQGFEAGGHRGSHTPTDPANGVGNFALVPQIVDAVRIPVVAAGGIADGRGIIAAIALGAAGVQIGTAFLSCPEASTDQARRKFLKSAVETDTMFTDAFSGRAARARRSRFAEAMERSRDQLPDFMHMYALSNPIREAADDEEASFHLYGQSARMSRELPAAVLVGELVREADVELGKLLRNRS